jgi:hypothetical protein
MNNVQKIGGIAAPMNALELYQSRRKTARLVFGVKRPARETLSVAVA